MFLAGVTGCASHLTTMGPVVDALSAGDVPTAVDRFDQVRMRDDDFLYLYERGLLLHLAGRYAESNDAFEVAEFVDEDLFTRSLSGEALALLTSDATRPYRGTEYELDLIPYYRALNYLALGEPGEAIVEARKADYRLAQREGEADPGRAEVPAFLHYVSGLLHEMDGEANDAVVSFREAARLYAVSGTRPPPRLVEDYWAAARHLGLSSESDSLETADPGIAGRARGHDEDNLVMFIESGFVPYRQPVDIVFPILDTEDRHGKNDGDDDGDRHWDRDHRRAAGFYVDRYRHDIYSHRDRGGKLDHVLRFSFPELVDHPSPVAAVRVILPGGGGVDAAPALDLGRAAHAEFEDRIPGVLLKTVARALGKESLRKAAKKKDEGFGALVNLIGVATEQADTRGGLLLPRRIDVVKARIPESGGRVVVRFLDDHGVIVEEDYVDLPPGPGVHFVSVRSFR